LQRQEQDAWSLTSSECLCEGDGYHNLLAKRVNS